MNMTGQESQAEFHRRAGALGAATLHEAAGRIGALPSAIQPLTPSAVVAGRTPAASIRTVDATPSTSSRPEPLPMSMCRRPGRSARNASAAAAASGEE